MQSFSNKFFLLLWVIGPVGVIWFCFVSIKTFHLSKKYAIKGINVEVAKRIRAFSSGVSSIAYVIGHRVKILGKNHIPTKPSILVCSSDFGINHLLLFKQLSFMSSFLIKKELLLNNKTLILDLVDSISSGEKWNRNGILIVSFDLFKQEMGLISMGCPIIPLFVDHEWKFGRQMTLNFGKKIGYGQAVQLEPEVLLDNIKQNLNDLSIGKTD